MFRRIAHRHELDAPMVRYRPLFALVAAMIFARIFDAVTNKALLLKGALAPRRIDGLDGVILAPYIHADWGHLAANIPPLLLLGGLLLAIAPRRFWPATGIIVLASGLAVWVIGRPVMHVGASGLIFGWFGLLATLAVIERRPALIVGALAALAVYGGSMLAGIAPAVGVSWEFHIFGLAAGCLAGVVLKRQRPRTQAS